MQPTLLILAAGIGSRYGGLKQIDGMGPDGEAILEYSVADAIRAGFGKVVFVIRQDIETEFRQRVGHRVEAKIDTRYAFQQMDTALEWLPTPPHREKPWGTAHAILAARQHLTEPFVAINADDFYGAEAFAAIGQFLAHDCTPDTYAMVAYRIANTLSENGSVSRGVCAVSPEGYLTDVVERHKIERFDDGIHFPDEAGVRHFLAENTPVSMNFWGFHHALLPVIDAMFRAFVVANEGNPRAEFYIPTVVNQQIKTGAARVRVLTSENQWYGVTYPEDKATVQAALRAL
jgi:NDP-sugar pyrophosphorylase family protein